MTALVNYTDVMMVQSSETWDDAGTNYIDNRSQWFNKNDASVSISTGAFKLPSGTNVALSDWVQDSGPNTLTAPMQEARAFCLHGEVIINFTGTTLVLRVNTDYGWGNNHQVQIDGVNPTTISGVLSAVNTISCDSATYALGGPAYVDVLIADGLSNGAHTAKIFVNQTGSLYFSFAGYKVYGFTSRNVVQNDVWIMPSSFKLTQNAQTLSFINKGGKTFLNATVAWPAGLTDGNNAALVAKNQATLTNGNPIAQSILPSFGGNEVSGQFTYPLSISAQYQDPSGAINQSATTTLLASSPSLTLGGTTWSEDTSAPGGVPRIYSSAKGSTTNQLTFQFTGSSVQITVEQNFGYGIFNVYNGATLMGTVSCNAASDQLFTATISGWPATGTNTCTLRKSTTDTTKFVVFVQATWTSTTTYTQINETVNLVMEAQQPYAMPALNVQQGQYALSYDAPIPGSSDLVDPVVRQNTNIAYTEVLERFPTYAVCYQPGYADVLSQYDILIVDPFAAKAADVIAWQALGIKVFGYISLGEEDGFYSNRYDFLSANAPFVGNGQGPGGNADYYLKGGYQARECTECTFDNQAVAGTKTCAQSQPMYYMGTGRCSGACSYDSLNGYLAFSTGGACGAGFTSANNWQRPDANTACTNAACPSFKPVHQLQTGTKCPKYSQVDNAYLQDFSIANPNTPDQNGVWASFYADAGKPSWLARILSYYAPTVLGGPIAVTNETVTVKTATTSAGSVFVFDTAQFPVDGDSTITLTTLDGVTGVYAQNADYSFDMKTGAFVFNAGIAVPVTVGQQLKISYTKKGHHMDGIFMDTIDDSDVYPQMGNLMAALVNNLKANTGTKLISNRGFTNLNNFIQSCVGVMFESWLTGWNENTGAYYQLTDADSLTFNNQVNAQLFNLRMKHTFDVYSLNYCNADASGNALRLYCAEEDRKKGYLSWTSTIDLNLPAPNNNVATPGEKIQGTAFTRYRIKHY